MITAESPGGAVDCKEFTVLCPIGGARPRWQAYGLPRGRARRPVRPNQQKKVRVGKTTAGNIELSNNGDIGLKLIWHVPVLASSVGGSAAYRGCVHVMCLLTSIT